MILKKQTKKSRKYLEKEKTSKIKIPFWAIFVFLLLITAIASWLGGNDEVGDYMTIKSKSNDNYDPSRPLPEDVTYDSGLDDVQKENNNSIADALLDNRYFNIFYVILGGIIVMTFVGTMRKI
jgi:hypothetical protein